MKNLPVSELNYNETMTTVVEPYLESIRKDDYFTGVNNGRIHYEQYLIPDAKASIVISHGFTESAEKFREMSYCFIQMGYNVFVVDHRGHGLSVRLNEDKQTVAIGRFSDYVADLNIFVNQVVKIASGKLPLYLYSHSMGGAVAIQYLQEYPGDFSKAVLSAPMVMPQCNGMKPGVAKALMSVFCAVGKSDDMVFVYNGFNPNKTYENSHDTSKARFDYYQAKRCKNENLQTASASYRWVKEAVKVSKKNLDPERCKKITIPVLLCQPEEDSSVYSEKEDEFIALIPNGKLKKFTNCKHEIYASVDDTLFEYLNTIEEFLAD